ncbi:MAG: pyridoxamine 5-phosphate oxidase [Pseudonocardiales bacterium]|jgi:pyridoxamine 5'-phosphate oxidase|nr:pyridoxamine 5-phosphate oxidase [Pseudonocardiales bacterium]
MTASSDPAGIRRAYLRGRLDETLVSRTWLDQFRLWLDAATGDPAVLEPTAMQLATVDTAGHPSVRTVLLKGFDDRGVAFFTNYDSPKGVDLDARPYASAVFVWLAQERQVRLSGQVTRVDRDETAAYFTQRPRGSQLGAWASPQSQVIASRVVLEQSVTEVEERFTGQDVPPPPFWGGYRIAPDTVEFWQGRPDRLHDRLRYRRDGEVWVLERLAP